MRDCVQGAGPAALSAGADIAEGVEGATASGQSSCNCTEAIVATIVGEGVSSPGVGSVPVPGCGVGTSVGLLSSCAEQEASRAARVIARVGLNISVAAHLKCNDIV